MNFHLESFFSETAGNRMLACPGFSPILPLHTHLLHPQCMYFHLLVLASLRPHTRVTARPAYSLGSPDTMSQVTSAGLCRPFPEHRFMALRFKIWLISDPWELQDRTRARPGSRCSQALLCDATRWSPWHRVSPSNSRRCHEPTHALPLSLPRAFCLGKANR